MKKYMTTEQELKCHAIIHAASMTTGAIGFGLAKIPGHHHVAITPVQTTMIVLLGKVFGRTISRDLATATAMSKLAKTGGIVVAGSLWRYLPGVGNALNAGTAGVLTEGLGWLMANEFAQSVA